MTGMQIGMIIYIVFFTIVGASMFFFVRGSGRRFVIAGKRLPFFLIGTMLFSQALDANSTLGSTAGVYTSGFWYGFVFPFGLALCLLVVGAFYAKTLNRMNLITLPDYYFRRFNNTVEIIVGLLMAFSFVILVAGNMAGAAYIMQMVFGINFVTSLTIMSIIVLIYTFLGGLYSCAATDMIQDYVALGAFVAAAIWMLLTFGWGYFAEAIPPDFINFSGLTSIENLALVNWAGIAALALGDVIALDFMERVFAARTPEIAQRGCYYGAFFTCVAGLAASLLGLMALKLFPGVAEPRTVLQMMAMTTLPFFIGLFIMAGVVGAGVSTANGGALAVASVFARNLWQRNIGRWLRMRKARKLGRPPEEVAWKVMDERLLWYARLMIIPVMAISAYVAYVKPQPGMMLVLAFDVVFAGCLVPLTLGMYWKKANAWGALAAVIVGSLLRLVLYFSVGNPAFGIFYIPVELAGLDTLIPPVVSLIVMVPVSLLTQKQDPPKHEVNFEVPTDEQVALTIR